MKTKITGIMFTRKEVEDAVREVVHPALRNAFCRPFDTQQVLDAVAASVRAFDSAISSAGNGMYSTGEATVGNFTAKANINDGELGLYFNVESL
jgi:hypothetical protein